MPQYEFSLILCGLSLRDDEPADALYEMFPDSTLSGWQGEVLMDLRIEADTAVDALRQARVRVERVKGVRVVALHEDIVGIPDIAMRTGRTDESIRQHVRGLRGKGGFPPAVGVLKGGTMVWRWSEIAPRLCELKLLEDSVISFVDRVSAAAFALELAAHQSLALTMMESNSSSIKQQRAHERGKQLTKNSRVATGVRVTPGKVATSKTTSKTSKRNTTAKVAANKSQARSTGR